MERKALCVTEPCGRADDAWIAGVVGRRCAGCGRRHVTTPASPPAVPGHGRGRASGESGARGAGNTAPLLEGRNTPPAAHPRDCAARVRHGRGAVRWFLACS